MITSLEQAIAVAHTLSEPSKMPWYSYSIPAQTCHLGRLLASKPATVCSACYAWKGNYRFNGTQKAMWLRFLSLRHPDWVEAMAFQINYHATHCRRPSTHLYFRWHDSGDLQGPWHFLNIMRVAELTPTVRHWLPTREQRYVSAVLDIDHSLPSNLTLRMSTTRVGVSGRRYSNLPVATVDVPAEPNVVQCEALKRAGRCGACRECWTDKDINYPLH